MDFYYYFLKSSVNEQEGVINAVLKIDDNQSTAISTRIKTKKKNWNSKEQCFEGKDSANKEQLKRLFEKRMESIRDELAQQKPYEVIEPNEILRMHREDRKQIKTARKPENRGNETFIYHFGLFIKQQIELQDAGRLAQKTTDGYIAKRNRILEYLQEKNLVYLKTEDFTSRILEDFSHWLVMNGKQDSTITKYARLIKTVTTWARKKGYTETKPLEDYKIENAPEKDPVSLETWELELIEDLRASGELNEHLCKTADIYRFCAETSLSFCDYISLKNEMLTVTPEARIWIHCYRAKSKVLHRIPLTKAAIEILKRYGSLEELPRISNYHANKGIRKIAKLAGIKKYLTFHTSRKSAVNNMLNDKGMRETTIQAIVGWKDGRQLKRYAKVSDSTIEREFFSEK